MAFSRAEIVQPGLLEHGPEEKFGFFGRAFGFAAAVMDVKLSVGDLERSLRLIS